MWPKAYSPICHPFYWQQAKVSEPKIRMNQGSLCQWNLMSISQTQWVLFCHWAQGGVVVVNLRCIVDFTTLDLCTLNSLEEGLAMLPVLLWVSLLTVWSDWSKYLMVWHAFITPFHRSSYQHHNTIWKHNQLLLLPCPPLRKQQQQQPPNCPQFIITNQNQN